MVKEETPKQNDEEEEEVARRNCFISRDMQSTHSTEAVASCLSLPPEQTLYKLFNRESHSKTRTDSNSINFSTNINNKSNS